LIQTCHCDRQFTDPTLSPNIQFQLLFHHLDNGILCLSELLVTCANVLVILVNCDGRFSESPFRFLNNLVAIGNMFSFLVNFIPEITQSPRSVDTSRIIEIHRLGAGQGSSLDL
jgi:hypothetical protein